ncbi:MAG: invasion associated locus B family protein [Dongiales bacterium]
MGIRLAIGAGAGVVVAIGAIVIVLGATGGGPAKQPSVSLAISTPVAPPPAAASPAAASPELKLAQAATAPAAGSSASTLPGGASSLQETYDDWQVACGQQGGVKRCAMGQQQISKENRQRVLDIELWPSGDKLEGALMLPFGLALDQGVTLQIDDAAPGQPLHFRTCLPGGCVVPLSFDGRSLTALLHGAVLKVKAVVDGGGIAPFTISLKGFSGAYNRSVALAH